MKLDAADPVSHATIGAERLPCQGCGMPTVIRHGTRVGHFACLLKRPETDDTEISLYFLTKLRREYPPRRSGVYWAPKPCEITDLVRVSSWTWERQHHELQERVVLDRSGAFISAAASLDVAAGELEHTGLEPAGPGFCKVVVFPWAERGTPHPLGAAAVVEEAEVWVPHTRARLLADLAREGRYPEGFLVDSWTSSDPVRLSRWTTHVNEMRCRAITTYGRDSAEYDRVKTNFSQARALMLGSRKMGQPREWKKGTEVRRPDIAMQIEDLSAVVLWRWCDELDQLASREGAHELAPIGMRATDELIIPAGALELFTSTRRSATKGPLQIDPSGMRLGTFKVKGIE